MPDTFEINLIYPLDFNAPSVNADVKLRLRLPAEQVQEIPLRKVPNVPRDALSGLERFIRFNGVGDVRIHFDDGTGGAFANAKEAKLDLNFGIGEPFPTTISSRIRRFTPLLFGSIAIPRTILSESTVVKRHIGRCWPTHDEKDVEELQFEPSGFYLVGQLPEAMTGTAALRWALRVPQPSPARDANGNLPGRAQNGDPLIPVREPNDHRWVLTAEQFEPDNNRFINSRTFLTMIGETFAAFKNKDGKTLLDNVVTSPPRNAVVEIERSHNPEQIVWRAAASGTRLVIGGAKVGESQFIPELLEGSVRRQPNRKWAHQQTRYVAGRREVTDPQTAPPIEIGLRSDESNVGFQYPEEQIVALRVPTVPTEIHSDDSRNQLTDTVERAWLCVQQGWLGLDTDKATTTISPRAAEPGRMGLVNVDRLLEHISPPNSVAAGGFQLQLLPVLGAEAGGDPQMARHVSLALKTLDRPNASLQLKLTIEKPLTLLTTPPVWLKDSDDTNPEVVVVDRKPDPERPVLPPPRFFREREWVPSLAVRLEKTIRKADPTSSQPEIPVSERGEVDDPENALRESFFPGDWVSQSAAVIPDLNKEGTLFAARVKWNNSKNRFEIAFPTPKTRCVFWKRPASIPLVRTFPLLTSQVPTVLLEDNRGYVPLELRSAEELLQVRFPPTGLPQLDGADFEFGLEDSPTWQVAPLGGSQFMLPTLPGLEALISAAGVRWKLRHAVPVLDEAYREVTESNDTVAPDRRDTMIDVTRVEAAVALGNGQDVLKPGGTVTATGAWLPEGTTPAANTATVELFSVTGRNPQLDVKLANNAMVSFARNTPAQGAGVTQDLDVVVTAGTSTTLPVFAIEFATSATPVEIRRSGHPLIARFDATYGTTTFDGKGTVRHEPDDSGISHIRAVGDNADRQRLTGSFSAEDLFLDLVGIEAGNDKPLLDLSAQQWMFHDGTGDWPLLFGFVLQPISLKFDNPTGGEITAALVPAALAARRTPRPVTSSIQIKFKLAGDQFSVDAVTGSIHWCFDRPEHGASSNGSRQDVPSLVEVRASIEQLASDHLKLNVTELILSTPTGIVRCAELNVPAQIRIVTIPNEPAVGQLIIEPVKKSFPVAGDQIGAAVELGEIRVPATNAAPLPIRKYEFTWTKSDGQPVPLLTLGYEGNSDELQWHFELVIPGFAGGSSDELLYKLKANHLRKRVIVFEADAGGIPAVNASFFAVTKSTGILAAEFSNSVYLRNVSGELLLHLQTRGADSESLVARLSIAKSTPRPILRTTGTFTVNSAIALKRAGHKDVKHSIRFFLDDAELPVAAVLRGKHPLGETKWVGAVAEHTLVFDNEQSLTWHVAQWVRLTAFDDFVALQAPLQRPAAVQDDDLIIDAATVLVLQSGTFPDGAPVVLPDLENPGLGVSIAVRAGRPIELDRPAHVVRLPFAALAAAATPIHTITLDAAGPALRLDSKGAQHAEIFPLFQDDPTAVQFFNRSPQAGILHESAVRRHLEPLDGEKALPAYDCGTEIAHSHRLPQMLGDLSGDLIPTDLRRVTAACLVRRHPVQGGDLADWWERFGQVLSGSTLFAFPYVLSVLPAAGQQQQVPVQLLDVSGGQLRLLARSIRNVDAAGESAEIRRWAAEILQTKPRGLVAVVLKRFSEFEQIPASFEELRDEIPDSAFTRSVGTPVVPLDPRCRIPGPLSHGSKLTRLKALPDRTIFSYEATIPKTETTDRAVVAATHFRLAAVSGDASERGSLRNAAMHSDRLAALSQWDEVTFEVTKTHSYPETNSSTMTNLLPPTLSQQNATLVPPLLHVVSWASRPGEMTGTTWGYEEHRAGDVAESVESAVGLASVTSLRRPRAQAGTFESARLIAPDDHVRKVFNSRFKFLKFDLEQTLGRTPLPPAAGVVAALVTRDTFFPSFDQLSNAETEPGLIYRTSIGEFEQLELVVFAGSSFDPATPQTPSGKPWRQFFLTLRDKGVAPPAPYPDNGKPDFTGDQREVRSLNDKPAAPDWQSHELPGVGLKVYSIKIPFSKNLLEFLKTPPTRASAELVLLRYRHNAPTDDTYVFDGEPLAISLRILQRDAAIRPPAMSVTLLAGDADNPDRNVQCAGYGRLGAEDFTPPNPELKTKDGFDWLRFAKLIAVDRALDTKYDVVVYGPGGEVIPTVASP